MSDGVTIAAAALLGGVVLGVDIGVALGAAALLGLALVAPGAPFLAAARFALGLDSFPLLAIPLFILAGRIMTEGGIARRLVAVLLLALGRLPGALGPVTVLSTFVLSGVCGSASADTAAIGAVTVPEMRRRGYPMSFAAAVVASAGASGHLLPPSIDLIIVGVVANISVGALFMAGIVPAFLNLAGILLVSIVIGLLRHLPKDPDSRVEWRRTLLESLPALLLPAVIIGGIRGGWFTPTESAAIAVLAGLVISMLVYRELGPRQLPALLADSCRASGAVLFVIGMASSLSFLFTFEQLPHRLAMFIAAHAGGKISFLLMVNLLFLGVGMVMDALPALIVLMPILVPLAAGFAISPVQFSIIVLANVGLSFIHPPVGLCLYIGAALAKVDIWAATRQIIPFFAMLLLTLLLIALFPEITLWLPRHLGLIQ
jgi:C4-dicarboxylate transporter DctM subunit